MKITLLNRWFLILFEFGRVFFTDSVVSVDSLVLFRSLLNEYVECISLDKGIVILMHEMKIVESFLKKKWLQLSLMFSLAVTTKRKLKSSW